MSIRLKTAVLVALAAAFTGLSVLPAAAVVHVLTCHDHPDGGVQPPTYGLRIDDLVGPGDFTFSFDHADVSRLGMQCVSCHARPEGSDGAAGRSR